MRHTPCQLTHLRRIDAQSLQREALAVFEDACSRGNDFEKHAWTLWEGETPVGAFGLIEVFPGIHEAWAYLGNAALARPVALARAARSALAEACARIPGRRIQASCLANCPAVVDWITFTLPELRFEGVLRGYGPNGEDMAIFGMVR